MAKTSLTQFTGTLAMGEYENAQKLAEGQIRGHRYRPDLLWALQNAALERILKDYESSNWYFDRAEERIQDYDQRGALANSAGFSLSILLNDSFFPFIGKPHDRVMVNTYKALNFAALGDFTDARVEFNRALYRQNEAKTIFAKEAQDLKNQIFAEQKNLNEGETVVQNTLDNPELQEIIKERYQNLDEFSSFADFINPFPTYMAGLFFWLIGDTAKATDILKEAYAMSDDHPVVASDFKRASRKEKPAKEVWVIYENGLAPVREESRMNLPVALDYGILWISAAFPQLTSGEQASPYLTITTNAGEKTQTEPLADMERVMAAQFRRELPLITVREVTRLAWKTYFQYSMNKKYGFWAGSASGIFQMASTAVDIRSWTALPKDFQAAHLAMPEDGQIFIQPPDAEEWTIMLPAQCRNVIVYIRQVSTESQAVYDVIQFF